MLALWFAHASCPRYACQSSIDFARLWLLNKRWDHHSCRRRIAMGYQRSCLRLTQSSKWLLSEVWISLSMRLSNDLSLSLYGYEWLLASHWFCICRSILSWWSCTRYCLKLQCLCKTNTTIFGMETPVCPPEAGLRFACAWQTKYGDEFGQSYYNR